MSLGSFALVLGVSVAVRPAYTWRSCERDECFLAAGQGAMDKSGPHLAHLRLKRIKLLKMSQNIAAGEYNQEQRYFLGSLG